MTTAAEPAGLRGADRRRPWRRYGQDFAEILLPAPKVMLCSPEEGEWRWEMQQAICREAKYDYDYPLDRSEPFLWEVGQSILFVVEGKLHSAVVEERYTATFRKRYWLKFSNGYQLALTEKQLSPLMQAYAAQFVTRVSLAIVPVECRAIVVWKPGGIDAIRTPTSLAASPVSPPPSIPPARVKLDVLSEAGHVIQMI